MRKCSLILILLVTACAMQYSDSELMAMDNQTLCETMHAHPQDRKVFEFMSARGLSCHPWQESCKAAGYKFDTKEFNNCTQSMRIAQEMADLQRARAAAAFQQGMQNYGNAIAATPVVPQVHFDSSPNIYCNSYQNGPYGTTNCHRQY